MTWFTFTRFLGAALPVAALAAPPAGEPLDPEKAFPATARATTQGIDVDFRILEGYYLYRDRFRVEVEPAIALGPLQPPDGEVKDDPFIGKTVILTRGATVRVPFAGPARPGPYRIRVTAQGCAEEKVCYAPFTQVLRVTVPGS